MATTTTKKINWQKLDKIKTNKERKNFQKASKDEKEEEKENFEELIKRINLEKIFSNQTNNLGEQLRNNQVSAIQILRPKKAYNLSILLKQTKLIAEELISRLFTLNSSNFSLHIVNQLINYFPDNNEMEAFKNYDGSTNDLNEADKFCFQLSKVSGSKTRLLVLMLKMSFSQQAKELKLKLETIQKANNELRKSKEIINILQLILEMGNVLNKRNPRVGEAQGFKINYLSKIDQTKSADGSKTFLDWLVLIMIDKFGHTSNLSSQLPNIHLAAKYANSKINEEIIHLDGLIKNVEGSINEMINNQVREGPHDKFLFLAKSFISTSKFQMHEILTIKQSVDDHLSLVASYFGENNIRNNKNDTNFFEIYSIFSEFVYKYEKAFQLCLVSRKKSKV